MGDGDNLWLGRKSLDYLVLTFISHTHRCDSRRDISNFRLDLRDFGAIGLETGFSSSPTPVLTIPQTSLQSTQCLAQQPHHPFQSN